jgi:hypothetical protein
MVGTGRTALTVVHGSQDTSLVLDKRLGQNMTTSLVTSPPRSGTRDAFRLDDLTGPEGAKGAVN